MSASTVAPFASAEIYRERGWLGTLPLPPRAKKRPPTGWTGYGAPYPSHADVTCWLETEPGNLALRLPNDVVGIDVDAYGAKAGAATLSGREDTWGPLPATWISTSRDDGVSGIRLYRVPEGLAWPGEVGPGIETIHSGHRYAMVWPSIHPDDRRYRWVGPDGQDSDPPRVGDLPELPHSWVKGLTGSEMRGDSSRVDPADDEAMRAYFKHVRAGEPCQWLARVIGEFAGRLQGGGSRHDATLSGVFRAVRAGEQGHVGAQEALTIMRGMFLAVAADRHPGEAEAEFKRELSGAVAKVNATPTAKADRGCCGEQDAEDVVHDDVDLQRGDDVGQEQHLGQVRMAYRLAAAYKDRLLYVHRIGWHVWDGQRWAEDDHGAAQRAVLDVLAEALGKSVGTSPGSKKLRSDVAKCESATGVAGVLGVASALTEFAATVRDLDQDPYLVNAANGTLDLRTGKVRPHEARDRLTKVTRAAYSPDADPAVWDEFIASVLPNEEVRRFLQRLVGLALLGKVVEHVLPILTGIGANGKGTTYKALLWALGDYADTVDPDLFMVRDHAHPTGEMDLRGLRLVAVSESDRDRRLAEATMKRLTGGDIIKARRMRQDFISFEPSHLVLFVTNHLPKVSGDDPAVWRRIRVVPFDVVFAENEQDKDLDDRLRLTADAILNWAVIGYLDYMNKGLAEPTAVRVATDAYQLASDAIGRFIAERCSTGRAAVVGAQDLYTAWETWAAKDGGATPMSLKAFGAAVDAKGYPAEKTRTGNVRRGLRLLTEAELRAADEGTEAEEFTDEA